MKQEWETVNRDLTQILAQQVGTAVEKLERMGDIIYNYREDRFGVSKRRSAASESSPGGSKRSRG